MKFCKGANTMLGSYFNSDEFDCSCSKCNSTIIEIELIEKLEKIRVATGHPLYILSGYRCENKQKQLRDSGFETAKGVSQHELGKAADIKSSFHSGKELEQTATQAGFMAIGVAKEWIHVDLRTDKPDRRWTYGR